MKIETPKYESMTRAQLLDEVKRLTDLNASLVARHDSMKVELNSKFGDTKLKLAEANMEVAKWQTKALKFQSKARQYRAEAKNSNS